VCFVGQFQSNNLLVFQQIGGYNPIPVLVLHCPNTLYQATAFEVGLFSEVDGSLKAVILNKGDKHDFIGRRGDGSSQEVGGREATSKVHVLTIDSTAGGIASGRRFSASSQPRWKRDYLAG
jgi:hypothetical protein